MTEYDMSMSMYNNVQEYAGHTYIDENTKHSVSYVCTYVGLSGTVEFGK